MVPYGTDPSDEALIRRVRDLRDERAFEELFGRHEGALAARVRRLLPAAIRRKTSVTDVLQETRITAFARSGEFESREDTGGPRAWLFRIAEMKARAAWRRYGATARRDARREVTRDRRSPTSALADARPSPSEAAMSRELRERVHRAIDSLPPDYAEVLRLTRIHGLTLAEAAERMGRSREAIKKLHGRAMVAFTRAYHMRGE